MYHYLLFFDTWPFALLQVPPQFLHLYEKHKMLFEREMKGAVSSFSRAVLSIQCHRMASLLKDVSSAARNEARDDVVNDRIFDCVTNLGPSAGVGAENAAEPSQASADMDTGVAARDTAAGDTATDAADTVATGTGTAATGTDTAAVDTDTPVGDAAAGVAATTAAFVAATDDIKGKGPVSDDMESVAVTATVAAAGVADANQGGSAAAGVGTRSFGFVLPTPPSPSRICTDWSDVPNMDPFPPGSEDYELFKVIPASTSKTATSGPPPVLDARTPSPAALEAPPDLVMERPSPCPSKSDSPIALAVKSPTPSKSGEDSGMLLVFFATQFSVLTILLM